ncbi:hypothetical protein HY024_02855 [Candidatus Curtissbacteria bacterium]|nr:hypothetical protein [Candidatus Curtissbacteria bacterium]
MELNDYLKIIRKNLLFIAVVTIVALLLGNFASKRLKNGFRLEQSFLIVTTLDQPTSQQTGQPSNSYDYSGYWEQEKARNFTDTAVALFQNPDFNASLLSPSTSIAVQKTAPQLFKVTISSANISDAKFDLDRLSVQFNQKLKTIAPQDSLQIIQVGTPQEPTLSKFDPKIITAASALLGLTISVILIAIKSYFRL